MITNLIIVWVLGVVSFFSLWALLAIVIRRISEKKQKPDSASEETDILNGHS